MIRILVGDVRERLRDLPDGSVQCVVTSPPYFGLRDYGTASWGGGDLECDHKHGTRHQVQGKTSQRKGASNVEEQRNENFSRQCRKCGATRIDSQIGLEPTLAEYVQTLVNVFRDVRRVLRSDGTLWLNMGDSYASGSPCDRRNVIGNGSPDEAMERRSRLHGGLKNKDLMMVPARVAIALQDDGWWMRSDIIWHKKNPMPESVTDRPTSSHEHIFLLTKSAKYFWDAEAVKEDVTGGTHSRGSKMSPPKTMVHEDSRLKVKNNQSFMEATWGEVSSRNMRNVWHLATEPFPDAHFATFPTEIPRRCIKAGTSEKGQCAVCGAPWARVVDRKQYGSWNNHEADLELGNRQESNAFKGSGFNDYEPPKTTGWQSGCNCNAAIVPCKVLDPFCGSGTTLLVADQLGRDGIGIELSPTFAQMAQGRITGDAPMFAQVSAD